MMYLTYKYRLKDRRAAKFLREKSFAVNQVWNYCNAAQRDIEDRYRAGARPRAWHSFFDLRKLTAGSSKELDLPSKTIGLVCRQYVWSRAAANQSLKFRSSFGSRRSLGWVPFVKESVRIRGIAVKYAGKTFRLFGCKRRPVPAETKGGAFVEDALGRWWFSIKIPVTVGASSVGSAIGIDLGLKTLATLSDGNAIPALKHYRRYERALGVAQRAGSTRRTRAIHAKIANARRDQLHKATTQIVRENSFIVVGNVSSSDLAKTRMAKSVMDAGWYALKSMLSYKCQKAGAVFLEVSERCTSLTCSECGGTGGPKGIAGLGIRAWECPDCGAVHDRDVNAAKNILRLGLSAQALAEGSRGSVGPRIGTKT